MGVISNIVIEYSLSSVSKARHAFLMGPTFKLHVMLWITKMKLL